MSRWTLIEHDGVPMTLMELSEISGVNYNTLRHRYHDGLRGEALIRPVVRKPPGFILFCGYCENEFRHHWRKAKYCSASCAKKGQGYLLKRSDVEPFAKSGATAKSAIARLDVSHNTFTNALKRFGLYQTWLRARYRKCSPKAGAIQSTARRNDRTVSALSATAGPSQR